MSRFVALRCGHERHEPLWVDADAVVAVKRRDLRTEVHLHGGVVVWTELSPDEVLLQIAEPVTVTARPT